MSQSNGQQRPVPGSNTSTNSNGQTGQQRAGPNTSGQAGEVWDEERLEQGLERLKELHIQLRSLRTCIPRLLEPLTTKQPSPESLFREFTESTRVGTKEVQEFKHLMGDEETKKVFAQARKSRAENPDNIKPWRAMDHPDAFTRRT
ncbi:hypothetical protein HYFRA_00007244 [Hymenoscyphus fraxineus]|uniref:Uncharacterized protein n=1 Tax=Hymenoscyphus fraxineus TaxID=746836 RepID=A0A9N9KZ43_9HELO|nr:hypothetical protein HYFRA_00007244 [Hymenoscyphus fraxineus]